MLAQNLERLIYILNVSTYIRRAGEVREILMSSRMLDPAAKSDPDKLVGRDRELRSLLDFIYRREERIAIVKGTRRMGKTSLVLTALKIASSGDRELKKKFEVPLKPCIPVYVDVYGVKSLDRLVVPVLKGHKRAWKLLHLTKHTSEYKTYVENLETEASKHLGVEAGLAYIAKAGVSWREVRSARFFAPTDLRGALETVSDAAEDCLVVVVFDEVQKVVDMGSRELKEFQEVLKYVSDNLPNIKLVLTGSIIRLTEEVVSRRYEEPLYGRPIYEINLGPLDRQSASEILGRGFKEENVAYDELVVDAGAVWTMGIPGWIVSFGRGYVDAVRSGADSDKAVRQAFASSLREMASFASSELENSLRRTRRRDAYLRVAQEVFRAGAIRWGALKRLTGLGDTALKRVLDRLILYGIVEKTEDGYYRVGDALMRAIGWRATLELSTCPVCGKGRAYIARPLPPFPVEVVYRPCNHVARFGALIVDDAMRLRVGVAGDELTRQS